MNILLGELDEQPGMMNGEVKNLVWDPIGLLMDGELTCFQFSWFIACLPLVSGLIYKSWRVCVFDAKI